ncbi:metal-dependent hydrolase [Cupriavidus sp. UME77]|uniref:metal-dependent hydrolase n=1 Tax=Cupriavidus sp. UME77 TaxID=1862321 RepID=UPI0016001643|nr:metal-dependent hydrolase [Cupriavidus sp. UME77]MBB1630844.1 hydrolase [Cupriavidus sp. UME77]
MPTYLHCAPPLALAAVLGRRRVPAGLLLAGVAASIVPDVDMLNVWYAGVRYNTLLGHRGLTHSIGFAVALGLLAALAARRCGWRRGIAFVFVALSAVSHPLLDLLTDRGIGTALFYPFADQRVTLPWRPLPLTCAGLFGATRFWLECLWIGLPLMTLAASGVALRQWIERDKPTRQRALARAYAD